MRLAERNVPGRASRCARFLLQNCYKIVTPPLIDPNAIGNELASSIPSSIQGARKRLTIMTDTNFDPRHGVAVTGRATAPETDGAGLGDDQFGTVRQRLDRARAAIGRWPLPVRLMCIVCLITIGWFLIMVPLFILG